MAAMVDWEYYNSLYNTVDQPTFHRLEPLAEKQVRTIIGTQRWNSINTEAFYYAQLMDCVCAMVNKLSVREGSGVGMGLSSVSNDGYTENYTVQTQSQMANELRSCVVEWLSGTGLVGAYKC